MDIIRHISGYVSLERGISEKDALLLETLDPSRLFELFTVTGRLRRQASGNKVYLCSIVNAKSGRCPEDCAFCAQSARYKTKAQVYDMMKTEDIEAVAKDALKNGAGEFSIVTSGKGVTDDRDVRAIEQSIKRVAALGLSSCVSPGIVEPQIIERWKRAGLERFHHNLEAAPSFFDKVCTTHRIEEDIEAVRAAKSRGLEVCCGGIFGMGESFAQRVELFMLLRQLEVDSVPVNFLNPIPGTPMENAPGITPLECLMTISLARLVMPAARVIVCGGREVNLRDLQCLMFQAGANGILTGNYLTTSGRPPGEDMQMIKDLGLEPAASSASPGQTT